MTFDISTMVMIGAGERSKVYQHPSCPEKVVKVTKSPAEKAVLQFMLNNPRDYFVQVYSIEKKGAYIYATIEKLHDVSDVIFDAIDGKKFFESAYPAPLWNSYSFARTHHDAQTRESNRLAYIDRKVSELNAPEAAVREYYGLLELAVSDGLWIADTAWNLGRRADGSMCCYDSSFGS